MAATYRSTAHTAYAGGATASITISKPAGLAVDDILLAVLHIESGTVVSPTCAGFVIDSQAAHNPGTADPVSLVIMWKRATSADVAATSFTFSWTGSLWSTGDLHAFSGAVTSGTPLTGGTMVLATGTTIPSVSYTAGSGLGLWAFTEYADGSTITTPSGYTSRASSADGGLRLGTRIDTAGASTSGTGSSSSGESKVVYAGTLLNAYSPPSFVMSASSADYITKSSPKTATITTQPGDIVVVYGATENGAAPVLGTPSGNGVTFILQQSIHLDTNWADAYIWAGTDTTGASNWNVAMTGPTSSYDWGFTALVFRNSSGVGTSNKANVSSGAPTVAMTTTQPNSALVVMSVDWNAATGASRTWAAVNGITPTSGNGLETTYVYAASQYTVYGAYYSDAGTNGAVSPGLTSPSAQKYSIVGLEIKGLANSGGGSGSSGISVAWII